MFPIGNIFFPIGKSINEINLILTAINNFQRGNMMATKVIFSENNQLIEPFQAAEKLGVKRGTLAVWRSTGRYSLPFVKIGAKVKYRLQDLETFIQSRVRGGHTDAI